MATSLGRGDLTMTCIVLSRGDMPMATSLGRADLTMSRTVLSRERGLRLWRRIHLVLVLAVYIRMQVGLAKVDGPVMRHVDKGHWRWL